MSDAEPSADISVYPHLSQKNPLRTLVTDHYLPCLPKERRALLADYFCAHADPADASSFRDYSEFHHLLGPRQSESASALFGEAVETVRSFPNLATLRATLMYVAADYFRDGHVVDSINPQILKIIISVPETVKIQNGESYSPEEALEDYFSILKVIAADAVLGRNERDQAGAIKLQDRILLPEALSVLTHLGPNFTQAVNRIETVMSDPACQPVDFSREEICTFMETSRQDLLNNSSLEKRWYSLASAVDTLLQPNTDNAESRYQFIHHNLEETWTPLQHQLRDYLLQRPKYDGSIRFRLGEAAMNQYVAERNAELLLKLSELVGTELQPCQYTTPHHDTIPVLTGQIPGIGLNPHELKETDILGTIAQNQPVIELQTPEQYARSHIMIQKEGDPMVEEYYYPAGQYKDIFDESKVVGQYYPINVLTPEQADKFAQLMEYLDHDYDYGAY